MFFRAEGSPLRPLRHVWCVAGGASSTLCIPSPFSCLGMHRVLDSAMPHERFEYLSIWLACDLVSFYSVLSTGLFRISAAASEVRALRNVCNKGGALLLSTSLAHVSSPHVVCGLLVDFLLSLPLSVIPSSVHQVRSTLKKMCSLLIIHLGDSGWCFASDGGGATPSNA